MHVIPVRIPFILDLNLLMEESFIFFLCGPLTLLLPLVLLSFQSFLETSVVKIILFFFVVLAFEAIINVVVLVETFLL